MLGSFVADVKTMHVGQIMDTCKFTSVLVQFFPDNKIICADNYVTPVFVYLE